MPQYGKPCGPFWAAWLFFAFLIALSLAPLDACGQTVEGALSEAKAHSLHDRREWKVLLHYKSTSLHGGESLVDDPAFFLSPSGKKDMEKELEATIKAFFSADEQGDDHAQCRFPARLEWIKKVLAIDDKDLPRPACKSLDELLTALKPRSAVLIFPVSHMNSPASMFGHTLLRIDSDLDSKLISYAINYSAMTNETNGFFFAFKGIFGYYKGYFSILPYYQKIKEYNGLENRDMWEYKLNLTGQEVKALVLHAWELKDIYSYYYFFDENCSYNLLFLVEAARPGAALTEMLPGWVIPMDTIKAAQRASVYSKETVYRPSRASQIRSIEAAADPFLRESAKMAAHGEKDPEKVLNEQGMQKLDKIKVLDLASEYVQYLYAKNEISKEDYLRRYLAILGARSTLGKGPSYDIAAPLPPEKGHGTLMLEPGAGTKEGAGFLSFRIRPANHDLMDPDQGYLSGAAISFFDTELRYNFTEKKLGLEKLKIIDITSIAEITGFFRPVSWKAQLSVVREEYLKREHRTVLRLNAGPGAAFGFAGGTAYGFIEPELKMGGSLEDSYALGAGACAGYIKPLTDYWKVQAELKAKGFVSGEDHYIYSAELNQRFTINPSNAIKVNIRRERFQSFYSTEVMAGWAMYF